MKFWKFLNKIAFEWSNVPFLGGKNFVQSIKQDLFTGAAEDR